MSNDLLHIRVTPYPRELGRLIAHQGHKRYEMGKDDMVMVMTMVMMMVVIPSDVAWWRQSPWIDSSSGCFPEARVLCSGCFWSLCVSDPRPNSTGRK